MRKDSIEIEKEDAQAYPDDPEDAKDRKSVLIYTDGFIIVTEFCERLAYYGFAGSLVLFFQTQLSFSNAEADIQYSYWSSACYITPLIGGYVADTYLGRYKTILICSIIYVVGLVLVTFGSIPGTVQAWLIFTAMYIIAIGTGGIKPNVSTLGADQFDDRYSQDRKEKESFFNWFYWSINLGALVSYIVVAYICQYGIKGLGGIEWGFFVGYMIPTVMMTLAVLTFVAGTPRYIILKPSGSILATTVNIMIEALGKGLLSLSAFFTRSSTEHTSNISAGSGAVHFLDRAKTEFGGSYNNSQVECVKLVTRLAPFLVAMVPFWGVYSQMSTAFQNQGCQMSLYIGKAAVPVSMLNIFDTLAILLLLPVFDQFIYPHYSKVHGKPMSMLLKIGWGFIFALLSMIAAAILEQQRLKYSPPDGNYYDESARSNISPCQDIDNFNPYLYQQWASGQGGDQPSYCAQTCSDYYTETVGGQQLLNLTCINCESIPQMSSISVFWQIPQFMLIGVSEILASITSLEFFYSQAPSSMRSVTQSFNLATSALGSLILVPLIYIVNSNPNDQWLPHNLNDGHLTWYFILLAVLMCFDMLYFWAISAGYEYKTNADLQIDDYELLETADRTISHCDVDPHTGHWSHEDPLTGEWTHVSSPSTKARRKYIHDSASSRDSLSRESNSNLTMITSPILNLKE